MEFRQQHVCSVVFSARGSNGNTSQLQKLLGQMLQLVRRIGSLVSNFYYESANTGIAFCGQFGYWDLRAARSGYG